MPQKLAEKIGKGEFVEMHELLPQEWVHTEREGEAPYPVVGTRF